MEGLPGTVIDTQLSLFLPLTSFPALLLTSSAFRSYFVIFPLSISWMLLLLMLILLLLLTLLPLLLMLLRFFVVGVAAVVTLTASLTSGSALLW